MKTILLKVEVPDDFDLPVTQVIFEKGNKFYRAEKNVHEITLPTEEEIYTANHNYNPNMVVGSINYIRWSSGFEACAKWLLNKLK